MTVNVHLAQIAQGFAMQREGSKLINDGASIIEAAVAALKEDLAKPPVVEPEPPVVEPEPPRPPVTTTTTVALSGLAKALAAAKAGERLVVDKTKVASFSLKNIVAHADGITVDLTNVIIGNLQVNAVENVEFLGVDLNIAQVRNSKNIRFTRALVHDNTTSGLGFYSCQGVIVKSSAFLRLKNGIVHDHCDNVTVEGNSFREMTSDGVTGVGVVGLRIVANDFTDANPYGWNDPNVPIANRAHPDAIQLFTRNAKRPSTDIYIAGNRITRGNGGIPQGIFITTQAGFEQFRYRNVVLNDNLIVGALYQGINVVNADIVVVTNNKVQPITGQKSWIKVENCDDVAVSHNEYNILTMTNNKNQKTAGNVKIDFLAA